MFSSDPGSCPECRFYHISKEYKDDPRLYLCFQGDNAVGVVNFPPTEETVESGNRK
jgi:hypothetical protein